MGFDWVNWFERLMGKVASDKCHKWVFKEPTECEPKYPTTGRVLLMLYAIKRT